MSASPPPAVVVGRNVDHIQGRPYAMLILYGPDAGVVENPYVMALCGAVSGELHTPSGRRICKHCLREAAKPPDDLPFLRWVE